MTHDGPATEKRIAVFFARPRFDDPPFDDAEYVRGYADIAQGVRRRGHRFCIVRGQQTYLGNAAFARSWEYVGGDAAWEERGNTTVDLVWNKDYFRDPTVRVVNDPAFDDLCKDKIATYDFFPHLSPRTEEAQRSDLLAAAFDRMRTELVVVKPRDGTGGQGVAIGTREQLAGSVTEFPVLVQEFIDTSAGIPGIAPGMHDLRILVTEGVPVASYVRMPRDGSYVSNYALGGLCETVPLATVPRDALAIVASIDAKLAHFPHRMYAVDLGLDRSGGWKLIELNSKAGTVSFTGGAEYVRYVDSVAACLCRAAL